MIIMQHAACNTQRTRCNVGRRSDSCVGTNKQAGKASLRAKHPCEQSIPAGSRVIPHAPLACPTDIMTRRKRYVAGRGCGAMRRSSGG